MTAADSHFVSFAQNREDVVLFRALKGVAQGFYIDVGAHDPVIDSVTKAFYDRGWRGINIEPAAKWHQRLASLRPRDINLNVAAWKLPGELEFNDIEGTGLSTVNADLAKRHRARAGFSVHNQRIKADTLASICRLHNVGDVHFLKIDVEGAEYEVLAGMDFRLVRPWIIVIEAIDPVEQTPTEGLWEKLLTDAGYRFTLFDGVNRFYCDDRRPELIRHLCTPANVLDKFVEARYLMAVPAMRTTPFPPGFGINLFGQFTSATGLGVTVRHTAKALRAAGIPFVCMDIQSYYPSGEVAGELADILPNIVTDMAALRFPINLYCMPVTEFPQLLERLPLSLRTGRFHAAIVWWETTRLHPSWISALTKFDALVAYSDFLVGVLANSLPLTPVLKGGQALFLPNGIHRNRATLGLPENATVFVGSFDPASDPARKNPAAIIAAFRQAFAANDQSVRLVLRLNNADATDMSRQTTRLLINAAAGDGRIGFALEPMEYHQVLALYASADVYVSLHRAEGLGLGMLEAMRLGIPVIATGWSGNMSFMDHRCAGLVRYRHVQVSGNHPFYRTDVLGPEAIWAEPVIEDAVAWMQFLHRNADARKRLGELAHLRAAEYQTNALALDWLHELAGIWRMAGQLPCVAEKLGVPKSP